MDKRLSLLFYGLLPHLRLGFGRILASLLASTTVISRLARIKDFTNDKYNVF